MTEFIQLLNSTSPKRLVFYTAIFLIVLIIITEAAIEIFESRKNGNH